MKEVQNASKIRRHSLNRRLIRQFCIVIFMFMLVGIGYRLRSWFQTKILRSRRLNHFWKPFRDVEYDVIADSFGKPLGYQLVKTLGLEELKDKNVMTQDVHQYRKDKKDRTKTRTQNISSQEDPDWRYTGSVWPMPRQQIFKELADIRSIGDQIDLVQV